jgi:hypothetical protein
MEGNPHRAEKGNLDRVEKGGTKNLKPVRTKDEARERGRNGGVKSGVSRWRKKIFVSSLQKLLLHGMQIDQVNQALIDKAKDGSLDAYDKITAMVGEKPAEKSQIDVTTAGQKIQASAVMIADRILGKKNE